MILTEIGEVGIHIGDKTHILRPSLYAMSRLGDPEEIVSVFTSVMSGQAESFFADCYAVLVACADGDITDAIGEIDINDNGEVIHRRGAMPSEHIVYIAQELMRHGIAGAVDPKKAATGKESDYLTEFNCKDMAALAIGHLGADEREAWNMTMTSIISALQAKFPLPEDQQAKSPSMKRHNDMMSLLDQIDQATGVK